MSTPFPGMDPYLEHPAFWPDFHNRLIAAISDAMTPLVSPKYYIALERRTYLLVPDDLVFVGRPDGSVVQGQEATPPETKSKTESHVAIMEVEVPMNDEVGQNFLEVHEVKTGKLVTVLELLSPANKTHEPGRREYERTRGHIFESRTNLVEID